MFERERPDIIESGDPYQVSWKAIASGHALRIPVVGFYHSHFAEAYLRSTEKFLGHTATEAVMDLARRYVCKLYNQFEVTLVPSLRLAQLLQDWGVENVRGVNLGVNTEVFRPSPGRCGINSSLVRHSSRSKTTALHWPSGVGEKYADAFPQLRTTHATIPVAFSSACRW